METTMRRFVFSGMAIMAVVVLAACGEKPNAPAAIAAPSVPVMPAHFYAVKDGKEYGYEQAISEDARRQGQAASKLMMFSYLGRKGDTYQVMVKSDNIRTVAECTKPCDFAKAYTFAGDRFISKETMRLTPEAIVTSVFADAMRGQLDQMLGEQKGAAITFWVDGEAKRLLVADASTSDVKR